MRLRRLDARAGARFRTIVIVTAALVPLVAAIACQERAGAIPSGGECFLATDCEPGLICVDFGRGIRSCTNDLSEVAGNPPEPPEEEGDAEPNEGGSDDATTEPSDASPDVITIVDAGEDG